MLPSSETSVNRNPSDRLSRRGSIQVLGPRRLERGPRSFKAGLGGDRLQPGEGVRVEGHPPPFKTGPITHR
jgi:hypothetical protein